MISMIPKNQKVPRGEDKSDGISPIIPSFNFPPYKVSREVVLCGGLGGVLIALVDLSHLLTSVANED